MLHFPFSLLIHIGIRDISTHSSTSLSFLASASSDHFPSLLENPAIMSSLVCLVLYLCLHACTARPLMVSDIETPPQLQLSGQVKSTADDAAVLQLDAQKATAVKQSEGIEGDKVKLLYSGEILQKAAERERAERLMLESPPSNADEPVNSKDKETGEDVLATDYEQPHRKPPIHNRGT